MYYFGNFNRDINSDIITINIVPQGADSDLSLRSIKANEIVVIDYNFISFLATINCPVSDDR